MKLQLLALLPICVLAATADFYIAPGGNDRWSGTLAEPNAAATDGPFASIARAQAAVRALRKSSPDRALTVMLRGGTYYLPLSPTSPGTLSFTQDDSGAATAPVTWRNYPDETPSSTEASRWEKAEWD